MAPGKKKTYKDYFDALADKSVQYLNDEIEVDFESLVIKAIELHTERNLDTDVDRFIFKVMAYAMSLHGLKKWFEINKPIAEDIIKSEDFDIKPIIEYFKKNAIKKRN